MHIVGGLYPNYNSMCLNWNNLILIIIIILVQLRYIALHAVSAIVTAAASRCAELL